MNNEFRHVFFTYLNAVRPVSKVSGDDGELDVAADREKLLCSGEVSGLARVEGAVGEAGAGGAGGEWPRGQNVADVRMEYAAVAMQLVVSQPRWQEVSGLEARTRVVTNNLKWRQNYSPLNIWFSLVCRSLCPAK